MFHCCLTTKATCNRDLIWSKWGPILLSEMGLSTSEIRTKKHMFSKLIETSYFIERKRGASFGEKYLHLQTCMFSLVHWFGVDSVPQEFLPKTLDEAFSLLEKLVPVIKPVWLKMIFAMFCKVVDWCFEWQNIISPHQGISQLRGPIILLLCYILKFYILFYPTKNQPTRGSASWAAPSPH